MSVHLLVPASVIAEAPAASSVGRPAGVGLCWLLSECGQQLPTGTQYSHLVCALAAQCPLMVGSCEASGSFTGLSALNLHPSQTY